MATKLQAMRYNRKNSLVLRKFYIVILRKAIAEGWSTDRTREMLLRGLSTTLLERTGQFRVSTFQNIIRGGILGASLLNGRDFYTCVKIIEESERLAGLRDLSEIQNVTAV